jgi:F-type H+-transporting ATPase subunit b
MHIPPDWGTFFLLIVSFLVFWFIFNRLFLQPFLAALSERERRLDDLGQRTAQLVREAEEATRKRAAELAAIRHQAAVKRDEARREAEKEAAELIEKARTGAHESLEKVVAQIEKELRDAELQLESTARALAAQLAERVLGRRLDGGSAQPSTN